MQVAGGPDGCRDPCPDPAPVAGYVGCAAGEAGFFSADDGQDEDGGGPWGGVCPLPHVDPCQGLPVTPYGRYDHAVSDVVRVLVPYF